MISIVKLILLLVVPRRLFWAKILDKGGQVDTFILDFEKAFDTHPHELLKCKLYGYGIDGKTLK